MFKIIVLMNYNFKRQHSFSDRQRESLFKPVLLVSNSRNVPSLPQILECPITKTISRLSGCFTD